MRLGSDAVLGCGREEELDGTIHWPPTQYIGRIAVLDDEETDAYPGL